MSDVSLEPPDSPRVASDRCGQAKPIALARALTSCPGVTVRSSIAVLGAGTAGYQLALAQLGFTQVTAGSRGGAALLRERYGCVCIMDPDVGAQDAVAFAAWRRRLQPAGTLVLDVSGDPARAGLADGLRAARFWMLQYRVFGMRQADGSRRRAVFLIARAPRSLLRVVPAGAELATLLGALPRRAA